MMCLFQGTLLEPEWIEVPFCYLLVYINIKTPPLYDFDAIFNKLRTCFNESMNTVLI